MTTAQNLNHKSQRVKVVMKGFNIHKKKHNLLLETVLFKFIKNLLFNNLDGLVINIQNVKTCS